MEDHSSNTFVLAQHSANNQKTYQYKILEEHASPINLNKDMAPFYINTKPPSTPSPTTVSSSKKIVFNNYHGRPIITSRSHKNYVCKMLPTVDDISSHELPKRYICLECGKRFVRPGSLTTHTYSHTGEKPFQCEVEGCGRRFSVISNLRRHGKIHTFKK